MMKKNILTLFVLLSAFALNAENRIALKSNEATSYTYSNESDISFKKSKSIVQNQIIKYTLSPIIGDSKRSCVLKFNSIQCNKKRKDSTIALSTEKPKLPLSYIIKRATDKDIKTPLNTRNLTLDSIIGLDSVYAHLFDDFVKQPDSVNTIAYKHFIKEEYGNNLVRSLTENSLSIAPDSAVKEKGTWIKKANRYGTFISNSETVYTLKEKKGNTYHINAINQIDKTKTCRYSIAGVAYLLEDADGQIVSDIIVDAETGLVKDIKTNINVKAKATPLSFSETTEESISDDIIISIKQTITKD